MFVVVFQAENMEDGDEVGTSVEVFVYDLSGGMAAMIAHNFIGNSLTYAIYYEG